MSEAESSGEAITEEGIAALREEIEQLEGTARSEMATRIKAARELGDLKENAEYHIAKEDQAHLETKIKRLRERLIQAGREAGSDPVWTFTGSRPASFWARRMAHETAVHRADAEITVGRQPEIDADIAVDGIDEWLETKYLCMGGL